MRFIRNSRTVRVLSALAVMAALLLLPLLVTACKPKEPPMPDEVAGLTMKEKMAKQGGKAASLGGPRKDSM